jgi:hypothetical protein
VIDVMLKVRECWKNEIIRCHVPKQCKTMFLPKSFIKQTLGEKGESPSQKKKKNIFCSTTSTVYQSLD